MYRHLPAADGLCRRSSHEERGLKSLNIKVKYHNPSRSSHEERGLKSKKGYELVWKNGVAPRMRSVD